MRLFVAIELNRDLTRELAAVQTRFPAPVVKSAGVRWTKAEHMHLTLKFLGQVRDVPAVCKAAGQVAGETAPFTLELGECGCFPPGGKVRIVYAAVRDHSGELAKMWSRSEMLFESIGFAREQRPFAAHLTIGRVKDDRSGGSLRQAVAAVTCKPLQQAVDSIVVMQSEPQSDGPRYTPLARCRFESE